MHFRMPVLLLVLVLSTANFGVLVSRARAEEKLCPNGYIKTVIPGTSRVVCVLNKSGSGNSNSTGGRDGRTSRRSSDPGYFWKKPTKPKVFSSDREWWSNTRRGWSPDQAYDLPTQDPCFGITDPADYVECQSIPWLGTEYESDDDRSTDMEISPTEAAQQVISKLDLTAASPRFGPNRKHHDLPFDTAVGYPVWLWVEGVTTSDEVVATAGSLTVRLSVRLEKVMWDLGDGKVLRCDRGSTWRPGRTPGEASPTCGHVYREPGVYTVRATSHWTISWSAGGESGQLPHSIPVERQLEVGEVHVLVR